MLERVIKSAPGIGPAARSVRQVIRRADQRLGRWIHLDEDPLSRHWSAERTLRRIRARAGVIAPRPGLFEPEALRREGVVRLPDYVPSEVVRSLREKLTAALGDPARRVPRQGTAADGRTYSWYARDLCRLAPEAVALLPPALIASLESYLGAHVEVASAKCWRNTHVPEEVLRQREINSVRWHCDSWRQPGLTKLFYLVDDVEPDQGPFQVQTREATRALYRRGFYNRNDSHIPEAAFEEHALRLTGRAGTALVCDTSRSIHRAGNPRPGRHRDIIQIQMVPAASPLGPDWLDERRTRISDREQTTTYYSQVPGAAARPR